MIEEFFMFVGAENEGADALLPTKRLAGWRRRTRSALAFDPHPKVWVPLAPSRDVASLPLLIILRTAL